MLCAAFCAMSVSAADLTTAYGQNHTIAIEDFINDSSWWTKITTFLCNQQLIPINNPLNGK